jgi:superfamily II helicase
LTESQKIYILVTIEKIVKEKIDELEESVAITLIELASSELTPNKV